MTCCENRHVSQSFGFQLSGNKEMRVLLCVFLGMVEEDYLYAFGMVNPSKLTHGSKIGCHHPKTCSDTHISVY